MVDRAHIRRRLEDRPNSKLQWNELARRLFILGIVTTTLATDGISSADAFVPLEPRALPLSLSRQKIIWLLHSQSRGRNEDDESIMDDDDDDDDDDPPDVNVADFSPPASFGLRGRSPPSQRKAMGVGANSMAKVFQCTNCGSEFVKWMGRCPTCKEWNCLQEHVVSRQSAAASAKPLFGSSSLRPSSWLDGVVQGSSGQAEPVRLSELIRQENKRPNPRMFIPDDDEFNTVLGGGLMRGSLILLGGDPGVGKSTLTLQIAAALAELAPPSIGIGMGPSATATATSNNTATTDMNVPGPVWYVSGEESPPQIASRAARLGLDETAELYLLSETRTEDICQAMVEQWHKHQAGWSNEDNDQPPPRPPPALVVIDSIQTMTADTAGSSAAGGVSQVRESVGLFLRCAKLTGSTILLVGHVTKSGDVAGPRTVEHMVDTVLYLEHSGSGGNVRLLRASKNRFGSSDCVGVYEMTAGRLLPVSDPSSLFLAHRNHEDDQTGSAIGLAVEGMRALTVEVQALATPAASQVGRRTVDGIPYARLLLLLGVLQKRCGILFVSKQDVYINVVSHQLERGREAKTMDLAVTVALVSSLASIPVRADTAFCGEVGLLGELRSSVTSLEKRLDEAKRMGFSRVVTPRTREKKKGGRVSSASAAGIRRYNGMEWIECDTLQDAIDSGLVRPLPKKKARPKKSSDMSTEAPGTISDLGLDEIVDDDPFS